MSLQVEVEGVRMGNLLVDNETGRLKTRRFQGGESAKVFMLSHARRQTKLPDLSLSAGFLAKKRIECLLAQMMTAKQQSEQHSG